MKKTQRKDARRNITKQIVSYLSIVIIAMLAVLAYLGINFAAKAIADNGNRFYDECNFRDVQIISTKLLTPDDMIAIAQTPGVSDVEGVLMTDGSLGFGGNQTDIRAVSLTERVNTVLLMDGRLPSAPNECVIEKPIEEDLGISIGDTVTVTDQDGNIPAYLKCSEYVVTGFVFHPDHSCWPFVAPGTRYIVVTPDAFDTESLENCFMTAEVKIVGTDGMDRFSSKYLDTVSETVSRLDALGQERSLLRYNDIIGRYTTGIDEGRADLDEAAVKLSDARAELDEGWDKYNEGLQELSDAEVTLADSQKQLEDAKAQLESGRAELDDAKARLAAAKSELDSGWSQLEDARHQLESSRAQLDDAKAQLEDAKTRLEDAKAQLEDAASQLESGYGQIEDAKSTIRNTLKDSITNVLGTDIANRINWAVPSGGIDLEDPNVSAAMLAITQGITIDLNRSMGDNIYSLIASLGIPEEELRAAFEKTTGTILDLSDGSTVLQAIVSYVTAEYQSINDKYEEFASAARSWDTGHTQYINGLNDYRDAQNRYNDGLSQYNAGEAEYQSGLALYRSKLAVYNAGKKEYDTKYAEYLKGEDEYARGLAEYNAGLEAYEEGLDKYQEGKKELEDALTRLEEGEEQYEAGLAEYNEGESRLEEAVSERDSIDSCHWVVLNAEGDASYLSLNSGTSSVSGLGGTFALIFVLVGALVIYATVGRIVDEQRRLVGATKALGFLNREILAKYMLFGVSGTVLGMTLGTVGGYFGIQALVLQIYGRYYVFGAGSKAFNTILTVIVFAGGLLLSSLAVWFACTNLMKSTAITLMQEAVPSAAKKAKKPGKKAGKGSLYRSLILLNMLSDKKRVAVTIASIAGCCSLLVAGLTMSYSIKKSVDSQFGDIQFYDMKITYNGSVCEDAEQEIADILTQEGASFIAISDNTVTYDVGGKLRIVELMSGDMEALNEFYIRRDPKTDQLITDSQGGIVIHKRNSIINHLKVGGEMTLFDEAMNPHTAKVSGIYINYIGAGAFMSASDYESIFGSMPVSNTFLVNYCGADPERIASRVSQTEGYLSLEKTTDTIASINELTSALDYLSLLFIAIAGMLAYFILMNLVNMYINQKKKELVIMRINGFTVRETIRYVSMELIISTILGIVTGFVTGSLLGYRIILLSEGTDLYLTKALQFRAWIEASLITIIFTGLISAWALRKVKKLKLTDAA